MCLIIHQIPPISTCSSTCMFVCTCVCLLILLPTDTPIHSALLTTADPPLLARGLALAAAHGNSGNKSVRVCKTIALGTNMYMDADMDHYTRIQTNQIKSNQIGRRRRLPAQRRCLPQQQRAPSARRGRAGRPAHRAGCVLFL